MHAVFLHLSQQRVKGVNHLTGLIDAKTDVSVLVVSLCNKVLQCWLVSCNLGQPSCAESLQTKDTWSGNTATLNLDGVPKCSLKRSRDPFCLCTVPSMGFVVEKNDEQSCHCLH